MWKNDPEVGDGKPPGPDPDPTLVETGGGRQSIRGKKPEAEVEAQKAQQEIDANFQNGYRASVAPEQTSVAPPLTQQVRITDSVPWLAARETA